jgi:Fe-S-cluster containining protein
MVKDGMQSNSQETRSAGATPAHNCEASLVYGDAGEIANFECKQCGNCCRGSGFVRITPEDAERIAQFLNIKLSSFYNQYTFCPDGLMSGQAECSERWLLDTEADECVFLENNLCRIHPVKPAQCRSFPSRWRPRDFLRHCKGIQE